MPSIPLDAAICIIGLFIGSAIYIEWRSSRHMKNILKKIEKTCKDVDEMIRSQKLEDDELVGEDIKVRSTANG